MFLRGFSCPVVLFSPQLRLLFDYRTFTVCGLPSQDSSSKVPKSCVAIWAFPRSLAATWRIDVSFFSSRYLDVSVHGLFPLFLNGLGKRSLGFSQGGCPIRRSAT